MTIALTLSLICSTCEVNSRLLLLKQCQKHHKWTQVVCAVNFGAQMASIDLKLNESWPSEVSLERPFAFPHLPLCTSFHSPTFDVVVVAKLIDLLQPLSKSFHAKIPIWGLLIFLIPDQVKFCSFFFQQQPLS